MIELGEISLRNRDSVIDARNKIRILALDLQFDSITAARLASVSSDIMRRMFYHDTGNHPAVMIALEQMNWPDGPVLKLKYVSSQFGSLDSLKMPDTLFDDVTVSTAADGVTYIEVLKALPGLEFSPTRDFIAREKELIERLTRDELYEKLRESYAKLQDQSAQLIQTEKLRTIGTIAAGVAHELNNPMMGILNYVQYCIKHTLAGEKSYPVLLDTEKEIRRCIEIVNNLLIFSRTEKDDKKLKKKANCAAIIDRILRLLSYKTASNRVLITRKYAENIPGIFMDANKIQQVFLNLINNALDALEQVNKKEINIGMQTAGNFLQVTIADTGIGIKSEHLSKIFDPFFTTKLAGKGTGLGLSVVHSIILQHNGKIECESEEGQGATFKVFLPINQ